MLLQYNFVMIMYLANLNLKQNDVLSGSKGCMVLILICLLIGYEN